MSEKHTQVPNSLFELMPLMKESELKVVLHAVRQTRGYHRATDTISFSQFMQATGLARQSVFEGIEAAKARGLLKEVSRGLRGVVTYRFIAEPQASTSPEFRPVQEQDRSEFQTATSPEFRPLPAATGLNSGHTKEKELKETERNKEQDARAHTHVSAGMAQAIDRAAADAYQPIDNDTEAMMQGDVLMCAYEDACKKLGTPQTLNRRNRRTQRIAAQYHRDTYTAAEVASAVNAGYAEGRLIPFAFLGEKMGALRVPQAAAKPRVAPVPAPPKQPILAPTSAGVPVLKRREVSNA